MFYYAPSKETPMETIVCTLTTEMGHTLIALVAGVQQMAGEDGYYGFICRYCDRRFAHEGEDKHERWCLVPLAEKLAPNLKQLEKSLQNYTPNQK